MRLQYDLHIHSCLSPCGEEEMTPANLVGMAALLELDVIALTDHNATGNCRAAMAAGRAAGLLVLPGMELCTAEEAHIVCLFAELEEAERFGAHIHATLPPVKNKPAVFGEQLLMDHRDNVLGSEELLLVTASGVSVEDAVSLCGEYGGVCYPAHIDRGSFSVLSSLGLIAPRWGFCSAEISDAGDEARLRGEHPILEELRVLRSSDAHDLETLAAHPPQTLELPDEMGTTARGIVDFLLTKI